MKCSNISYGIFVRPEKEPQPGSLMSKIREDCTNAVRTEDKAGKLVLLAHIVSTMGTDPIVTDKNMAYPQNWRDSEASRGSPLGHQEDGRTVCLHSLAVMPEVQGSGLGKLVVSAYLRAMRESELCDRVALLCQDVSHLDAPILLQARSPGFKVGVPTVLLTREVPRWVLREVRLPVPRQKRGGVRRRRLVQHGKEFIFLG